MAAPTKASHVEVPGTPLERMLTPFRYFAKLEAAGGILLLACAAFALICANSPWRSAWFSFWQSPVTLAVPGLEISKPLLLWINDGLMAVFFLVVGLEIKREMLVGELTSLRSAALPVAGALGGIAMPALFYALLNHGGPGAPGWGIPMATDIAFALGIMALLGDRVPLGLKVFLTAVAIVDDIAAVLVIAIFYTAQVHLASLGIAAIAFLVLALLNATGARRQLWFILPAVVLWVAMLKSGVHATIAGVLVAFTIPAHSRIDLAAYVRYCRERLDRLAHPPVGESPAGWAQANMQAIEDAGEKAQTPLLRFEHGLLPWVGFFIMPVFALANAGVAFSGGFAALKEPVSLGIICGLVLGKPAGIMLFAWLSVACGMGALPDRVAWPQILGAGCLAGVGFTMSLFIAALGLGDGDLLDAAKMGILAGSACSGVIGFLLLRTTCRGASK